MLARGTCELSLRMDEVLFSLSISFEGSCFVAVFVLDFLDSLDFVDSGFEEDLGFDVPSVLGDLGCGYPSGAEKVFDFCFVGVVLEGFAGFVCFEDTSSLVAELRDLVF